MYKGDLLFSSSHDHNSLVLFSKNGRWYTRAIKAFRGTLGSLSLESVQLAVYAARLFTRCRGLRLIPTMDVQLSTEAVLTSASARRPQIRKLVMHKFHESITDTHQPPFPSVGRAQRASATLTPAGNAKGKVLGKLKK